MDRLKTTLLTAFVIAILFTPTAPAQQAAKMEVVSGNGQMTCPGAANNVCATFYPMVVKVSDSSGNPIAGKTVTWALVVPGNGYAPVFEPSSLTDSNGIAFVRLSQSQPAQGNFPFTQSVISATVDNLSPVSFTETQALLNGAFPQVTASLYPDEIGMTLSGPAGSTGTTPIHVKVATVFGAGVPNVSVRLLSTNAATLASANCNTTAGADPGSVLTDANGIATCYPVFGSVAGSATLGVVVGGLDPAYFDYSSITPDRPINDPVGFAVFLSKYTVTATPVTPGRATKVSGDNQNIDPGKTSSPLVVRFTDSTGTVPVGNLTVAWSVSPPGAATVSPASSITDSQGQTQSVAVFAANAAGQVNVTAALTGVYSGISATFTLSTRVQIASLTKVSGDQQTTQSGQAFGAPLVVQVNGTNGQPLSGQLVSFVVNGNATLSANSAQTDGNGQARVSVTAGATPGAVTVTAFIGTFSAPAFTLTVIPPGPALTSSSFYNAGGGGRLNALSPCGLVTAIASGLAPNVQGLVLNSNAFGPWATTLANDTVAVNNSAAPIYSVGNVNGVQQITFQVPCDVALAASVPITINVGGGTGTANLPVVAATPGVYETVMSDGTRRAVAIRPDGTFVSLQNPARPGDVIRVFVTGLGPASPAMVSGALPFVGADSLVLGQLIVGVNNAGARVVTSRLSPNLIGVFEVDFQVPADAPSGNDVVFSVAVNVPGDSQTRFSNGSKLPITQ